MARVYISVSGAHVDDVERYRQTVAGPSLGLDPQELYLFRTSSGSHIPIAADSRQSMADRAAEAEAFLFFIDPSWMSSAYCYMELGAAWVRSRAPRRGTRRLAHNPELADVLHHRTVIFVHGGVDKNQIAPPEFPPIQVADLTSREDVVHATRALAHILDIIPDDSLASRVDEFLAQMASEMPQASSRVGVDQLAREAPLPGVVAARIEPVDSDTVSLVLKNWGTARVLGVQLQIRDLVGCDLGGAGMSGVPEVFEPGDEIEIPIYRNARRGSVRFDLVSIDLEGSVARQPHNIHIDFDGRGPGA